MCCTDRSLRYGQGHGSEQLISFSKLQRKLFFLNLGLSHTSIGYVARAEHSHGHGSESVGQQEAATKQMGDVSDGQGR